MGHPLSLKKQVHKISNGELAQMGENARKEREYLLKKRPHLRKYQEEIDRRLQNAGSPENRMAVLGIMMEGKLTDLREQLLIYASLLKQV